MAANYTNYAHYLNYPIGPMPEGIVDLASALPWLRKVDGLAIVEERVHLLEFKVWKPADGLDKLPSYKAGLPLSPWLGAAKDYPVDMKLVTPRSNPAIEATAKMLGIEIISVSGGWIDEVVAHIEWLWTAEGRESMARKRQMRAWLGLE